MLLRGRNRQPRTGWNSRGKRCASEKRGSPSANNWIQNLLGSWQKQSLTLVAKKKRHSWWVARVAKGKIIYQFGIVWKNYRYGICSFYLPSIKSDQKCTDVNFHPSKVYRCQFPRMVFIGLLYQDDLKGSCRDCSGRSKSLGRLCWTTCHGATGI